MSPAVWPFHLGVLSLLCELTNEINTQKTLYCFASAKAFVIVILGRSDRISPESEANEHEEGRCAFPAFETPKTSGV